MNSETSLDPPPTDELLAADELLPLVYHELRRLATLKLAHEKPGQTLQATALVHDVYLRLAGDEGAQRWNSRQHFFAAAAEAMRRILVENARRTHTAKRGGGVARRELALSQIAASDDIRNVLALDQALDDLSREDAQAADLIKLRFFAGLTIKESAEVLGISSRKTDFLWAFARAWLRRHLAAS
ncbi:MAG: ECF-type sigma factor [Planctomycetota bacterium]